MTPAAEPAWPGKGYTGKQITVYFDAGRCRHFAECVRGLPSVFDTSRRPWVSPDDASAEQVAEVIRRCPSGALHYVLPQGDDELPDAPTTVTVVPGGPLLLRGDLRIVTDGGTISDNRVALCSCGQTERHPFCDASCESETAS